MSLKTGTPPDLLIKRRIIERPTTENPEKAQVIQQKQCGRSEFIGVAPHCFAHRTRTVEIVKACLALALVSDEASEYIGPMGKTYRPDKFENFLNAFGAARLLLQEAHKNGSLLEGLVLYASMVDGFCRIALILKEQLESKGSAINESYIYQPSDKDFFSERKIFNLAHSQGIFDEELHREIASLRYTE